MEKKESKRIKIEKKSLKICLVLGLLLIIIGFSLVVLPFSNTAYFAYILRPFIFFFAGSIGLYITLTQRKNAAVFFASIFFVLYSCFIVFIDSHIINYTLMQMWPIIVILASISLFFTNLYKWGKPKFSYIVPSIVLCIMGILFLLFSLDVIKVSFITAVVESLPFLVIIFGLILIGLFFYVQKKEIKLEINDDKDSD